MFLLCNLQVRLRNGIELSGQAVLNKCHDEIKALIGSPDAFTPSWVTVDGWDFGNWALCQGQTGKAGRQRASVLSPENPLVRAMLELGRR